MGFCFLILDFWLQTKEHAFESRATAEFARLRKFQADLEEETGNACFVGLSVIGTAQQCVKLGNMRAAHQVQSEFRISERRYWWLRVRHMSHLISQDYPCVKGMCQILL